MSGNASSSNDSLLHPRLPLIYTYLPVERYCLLPSPSAVIFNTFNITNILLLLPLCVFILHHGLQQWRQKRSTSSAAAAAGSHTDCFTYHMVVMELLRVVGCICCFCGVDWEEFNILSAGGLFIYFTWFGETFFHVLTCVERYLAVVHPITYLSLRNQRGIRIRNISIACVWLLCFAGTVLMLIKDFIIVFSFFLFILSVTVTSFCSLSVLCVLIRPGPGEQGGGRERVDQSKKKAFYTIMAILGVLVLRCAWGAIWTAMTVSGGKQECVMMVCSYWFNLPSSLVLPVLFLHRDGKLMCWKKNIQ